MGAPSACGGETRYPKVTLSLSKCDLGWRYVMLRQAQIDVVDPSVGFLGCSRSERRSNPTSFVQDARVGFLGARLRRGLRNADLLSLQIQKMATAGLIRRRI